MFIVGHYSTINPNNKQVQGIFATCRNILEVIGMEHSFNVEIAKQYGIHEAIILKNLYFWIAKNKANEKHFYNGRYWTYNSKKAFAELFPYLTERQIKYALEKMKEHGLILVDNFNYNHYDRTCWYALTDKALKLFGEPPEKPETIDKTKLSNALDKSVPIDKTKLSNGTDEIVQPIPDSKQNINSFKVSKKETAHSNEPKQKTFNEMIDEYTQNEELRNELKEHLKTRKAKKGALTNHAIELSFKTLDKLAKTDKEKIMVVQQSIENGWTGFFTIKKENKQNEPEVSYNIDEYENGNQNITQEYIFRTLYGNE